MELFTYFHLFSFLPVIAIGGIFWFERMYRHGGQKRTFYLFLAIIAIAVVGILQTVAWTLRSVMPLTWPQLFVVSGVLYFVAFLCLEYAIHVKRIDESFLLDDFFKGLKELRIWFVLFGIAGLIILLMVNTFQWGHEDFPLNLFVSKEGSLNAVLGYTQHMRLLTVIFALLLIILGFFGARKIFDLQEGVIRRRGYPFYFLILVTIFLLIQILGMADPLTAEAATFLPIYWYTILNLVFVVRLVEEFFFWSQYNLRSDRNKMEQRQHTLNLLIRRVIGSAEVDDKEIVRETMENALEKVKSRLVVHEYRITGMITYRMVGNILRVEDPQHILGYCTPLVDGKNVKNLDKDKLTDLIQRTTYDIAELRESMLENLKDFGKKLVKEAMTKKQLVVASELPDGLKGLHRLAAVVPIFDSNNFMGFLAVFKDSFDRLYPAERAILMELSENLGTIFALISGKEIQRERNRLQGEMNTAREIQTSILPKKIVMPGYQVATYMETATEVGGDVFDFIPTPYGTYFGIGDVSGHGLPAGMMAVISVAALHGALDASRVLGKQLPLDQVYDTVNRVLCVLNRDRIGSDKFMTQNYFCEKNGKIEHVGTHLVSAVYRKAKDQIEELPGLADKTGFLGLSEYVVSNQSLGSFKMESGDILILYSDGVSEAVNSNGKMFALDGVKRAMIEHSDKSPEEIIQNLLEDLRRHAATGDLKKHGGHFTDDVSLVVLKKE